MAERRLHKRVKRFVRHYLLRALLAGVGALGLRAAKRLGAALGGLGFWLAGAERRKALASLEIAFPEQSPADREALARACFRHLGTCAGEVAALGAIDRQIERYVELPEASRRVLEEALAAGKGVLFVSGHVGNFELLARRIALGGFPCQTIAKEASDPRTTALVERLRARGRLKVIWRGQEGAARQMLRALKRGEVLGMLIDQDTRVQGVFVDFFGRPAFTPRAAGDLAVRTGAAVVMGFVFRRDDGGHRIELTRQAVPEGPDREAASLALTAAMTSAIERAIRRAPHAWVWMHQRWKTRPAEGAQ